MPYAPFNFPVDDEEFARWVFRRFLPFLEAQAKELEMPEVAASFRPMAETWWSAILAHRELVRAQAALVAAFERVREEHRAAYGEEVPYQTALEVELRKLQQAARLKPDEPDHRLTVLLKLADDLRRHGGFPENSAVAPLENDGTRGLLEKAIRLVEVQAQLKELRLPE